MGEERERELGVFSLFFLSRTNNFPPEIINNNSTVLLCFLCSEMVLILFYFFSCSQEHVRETERFVRERKMSKEFTVGVEREDDEGEGKSTLLLLGPLFLLLTFSLFFCFFSATSPTMVLATEPGIWVPAVVLGHLIGVCFLLYSLEKTNGSVSRLWKRLTTRSGGKGVADGTSVGATTSGGNAPPVKLMRGMSADNEPLHYERVPRWVRGCSCKVK